MSYMRGDLVSNDQLESSDGTNTSGNSYAEFTRLSRIIPTNIQKVSLKAKEIMNLVEQPETNQKNTMFQDRLQELRLNTNQLCHDTTNHLKEISNLPPATSESERRQRRVRVDRLKKDFELALNSFQNAQNHAADKEKEVVARMRALSTASTEGSTQPTVGYAQGNVELQQLTAFDLEELNNREEALKKLENDIMDVNQIFKDLAALVEEQGEVIDRIESNVATAEVKVEKANDNMQQAAENKSKFRKKKFICGGIIALVVLIVVLIIVLSVMNS